MVRIATSSISGPSDGSVTCDELLPARRAVDARGLVELARDRLQRRRAGSPCCSRSSSTPTSSTIAGIAQCGSPSQSIGSMPRRPSAVVHQAVARVQQVAPHHRHGDERRHHRREERGAEEGLRQRASGELQQQRRAQRQPRSRAARPRRRSTSVLPSAVPEERRRKQRRGSCPGPTKRRFFRSASA